MEAYAHIDEARIIYRMPNLHVSQYSMSKPQLRALRVSYPVFAPRDAPCYGSRFRVGFPRECLRALLVTVGGVGEACLSHLHAGRIVDFLMWSSRAAMRRRSRYSQQHRHPGHRPPHPLRPRPAPGSALLPSPGGRVPGPSTVVVSALERRQTRPTQPRHCRGLHLSSSALHVSVRGSCVLRCNFRSIYFSFLF